MKQVIFVFLIIFLAGCGENQLEEQESNNKMLENYFQRLLNKKVTATVYIVHPEVCGACSNSFLVKMSEIGLESEFYLLATGEFKEEHKKNADRIRSKIRFIKSEELGRVGLNTQFPQKIIVKKGEVISVEVFELR